MTHCGVQYGGGAKLPSLSLLIELGLHKKYPEFGREIVILLIAIVSFAF